MNIEATTDAPRSADFCGHSVQHVSPASSVPSRGESLSTSMDSALIVTTAESMDSATTVTTAESMGDICESGVLSAAGPQETSTSQASTSQTKLVAARLDDHLTGRDLKDMDDFGSAAQKQNHRASSSSSQTGIPGNFCGLVVGPVFSMPKWFEGLNIGALYRSKQYWEERLRRTVLDDIEDYENTDTGNSAARCHIYVRQTCSEQASGSDSTSDSGSDSSSYSCSYLGSYSPNPYDAYAVGPLPCMQTSATKRRRKELIKL